jgi:hypothetical protein
MNLKQTGYVFGERKLEEGSGENHGAPVGGVYGFGNPGHPEAQQQQDGELGGKGVQQRDPLLLFRQSEGEQSLKAAGHSDGREAKE